MKPILINRHKPGLTMPAARMQAFIQQIDRAELDEDPRVYQKAVCVTLLSLGYDLEWINGTLRPAMERYIKTEG